MFNTHCKKIQAYSQESADNLASVILMVSLSIQQNWAGVGAQLDDVKKYKHESKFLWGNKRKTYKYVQAKKHLMFNQYLAVLASSKSDKEKAFSLMKIFLRIDGLGMVKAGFVCQLSAGLVGCIDLHNIRLYGIKESEISLSKSVKSDKLRRQKIEKYISICHDIGTDKLWDNWCNHLATTNKHWRDGHHVSEVHYTYLRGNEVAGG